MATPTTHNPALLLPVVSESQPVMNGAAKPALLPRELMRAIPAAAPTPDKKVVGRYQNTGKAQKTPMAVKVTANITANGDWR